MNPAAYLDLADTEERHWWFAARRKILAGMLNQLALPERAKILEIGCGTSGNLDMLAAFGQVSAMEMDATARQIATQKTSGRYDIQHGVCPEQIPFKTEKFDLICMFDVLEHIDDSRETLRVLKPLLAPGGRILVAVPAYQWMWSPHDDFMHHKRRYTTRLLREEAQSAGLKTQRLTYCNTLLFPLAVITRTWDRLMRSSKSIGHRVPSEPMNTLLESVFACEGVCLRYMNLPFGLSAMAVFEAE